MKTAELGSTGKFMGGAPGANDHTIAARRVLHVCSGSKARTPQLWAALGAGLRQAPAGVEAVVGVVGEDCVDEAVALRCGPRSSPKGAGSERGGGLDPGLPVSISEHRSHPRQRVAGVVTRNGTAPAR